VIADRTAYDVRYTGKLSNPFLHATVKVSERTNKKLPARNTLVQLLVLYTTPESHNAQTGGHTDRRHDSDGDRAFPVAAARLWNSLPSHVTAALSLSIFCCRLKSHLFPLSYPAFWLFSHLYSTRAVTRHFRHYNRFYVLTFWHAAVVRIHSCLVPVDSFGDV